MNAAERLTQALQLLAEREQITPCQGARSARWTSDDQDDLEWAAFHCVSMRCPVLESCGAAGDEMKATAAVYGGRDRTSRARIKKAS